MANFSMYESVVNNNSKEDARHALMNMMLNVTTNSMDIIAPKDEYLVNQVLAASVVILERA